MAYTMHADASLPLYWFSVSPTPKMWKILGFKGFLGF